MTFKSRPLTASETEKELAHVLGIDGSMESFFNYIMEYDRLPSQLPDRMGAKTTDEFICSSCLLIKRIVHRADTDNSLCKDCV